MGRVPGVGRQIYIACTMYTHVHVCIHTCTRGYVRLSGWRVNARLSLTLERHASACCERVPRRGGGSLFLLCSVSASRGPCHTLLTRVAGRKVRWRVVKRIFYLYEGSTALNAPPRARSPSSQPMRRFNGALKAPCQKDKASLVWRTIC